MPTLEPIVVNAPKEKKTYTYSENDIVDIVAQAIKQGKIEAGEKNKSLFFPKGAFTLNSYDYKTNPSISLKADLTDAQYEELKVSKKLSLILDVDTDSQLFAFRKLVFNVISSVLDSEGDYAGQTTVGITGAEPFCYIYVNNSLKTISLVIDTNSQEAHTQIVQGFTAFLSTISGTVYYD